MKLVDKYNIVYYNYDNYYKFLISPELEYQRIISLKSINKKLIQKFSNYKKDIYSIIINEKIKQPDPILCYITKENVYDKEIRLFINNEIKEALHNLKKYNNNTNQVNIIKTNTIYTIEYNNYKIDINKPIYKRIKTKIIDDSYKYMINYNSLVWCIYYRYIHFGLYNNLQGATTEDHYNKINKKYNSIVEGFGSAFNHTLPYYFGLFPDLEQYFGCLGDFFNSKFEKGFFVINPPFTINYINRTIDHLLLQLKESTQDLAFLLIIPTWENNDREQLNKLCKTRLQINTYTENVNISKVLDSKYIKQYYLYCKENYLYFDFIQNKSVKFSATTIILLSNSKSNFKIESIFGNPNYKKNIIKKYI